MINLLSPEAKRDIRAARINVSLVQYCAMLLILTFLISLVYGIGFWLVMQQKSTALQKLESQTVQAKQYEAYQKQADSFRQDLKTAKTVLDSSYSYSDFLLTLARDMPSQTIIDSITLGAADGSQTKASEIDVSARASTYAKVLELKGKLEASRLFENVNILSYSRPDDLASIPDYEKKYPYEVTLSVRLSSVPVAAKTSGAAQ